VNAIRRLPLVLEGHKVGEIAVDRTLLRRAVRRFLSTMGHGAPVASAAVREYEQLMLEQIAMNGPGMPDGWCKTIMGADPIVTRARPGLLARRIAALKYPGVLEVPSLG
jgi:hypothetical protein